MSPKMINRNGFIKIGIMIYLGSNLCMLFQVIYYAVDGMLAIKTARVLIDLN